MVFVFNDSSIVIGRGSIIMMLNSAEIRTNNFMSQCCQSTNESISTAQFIPLKICRVILHFLDVM